MSRSLLVDDGKGLSGLVSAFRVPLHKNAVYQWLAKKNRELAIGTPKRDAP
jgi:hypothetical protein